MDGMSPLIPASDCGQMKIFRNDIHTPLDLFDQLTDGEDAGGEIAVAVVSMMRPLCRRWVIRRSSCGYAEINCLAVPLADRNFISSTGFLELCASLPLVPPLREAVEMDVWVDAVME
eukprot:5430033-Ditylum_brightwellii.AAC.1